MAYRLGFNLRRLMDERTERHVSAGGIRLRVTEVGSGPSVVLLHGLFFDRTCWQAVAEALSSEFRVVVPDLPGFGDSEKPPQSRFNYSIEAFTEVVADLFAALELGRAALVGHGLGGAVALNVAAHHPELLSELIVIDSLCYPASEDLKQRFLALPFIGNLAFKQLIGRATYRVLYKGFLVSKAATVEKPRIDRLYDAFNTPAARSSALAALRATRDTRTVIANTSRIVAPTLIVWGRYDKIYPALLGQRLGREIRGAGFELLETGHAPQEENPTELSRTLLRFLRRERPRAA